MMYLGLFLSLFITYDNGREQDWSFRPWFMIVFFVFAMVVVGALDRG